VLETRAWTQRESQSITTQKKGKHTQSTFFVVAFFVPFAFLFFFYLQLVFDKIFSRELQN
jgi:hypothetical protein